MADFTLGNIGGSGASPITPKAPVVDTSTGVALNAVGNLLSGGIQIAQGIKTSRAEKAKMGAINTYTQDLLRISEGVDQGAITSQAGRMRIRALTSAAIANNPALTADIMSSQKNVVTTSGLGKVVGEGTQEEQVQLALEKDAIEAGWIKPKSTQVEKDLGLMKFLQNKRYQSDIDDVRNELSLKQSKIGLSRSGLELNRLQAKDKAERALANLAGTTAFKFNEDMRGLQQRVENGEITKEDAAVLADQQWAVILQTVNSVGARAGGEVLGNLSKPIETIYKNALKGFSGETELKIVQDQNALSLALAEKEWMSEPLMASIAAVSKLFPNTNVLTLGEVSKSVVSMINKGSEVDGKGPDPLPDTAEDKKTFKVYTEVLKENMTAVTSGKAIESDLTTQDVNTNLVNLLKNIDAYSLSSTNPSDFNQLLDFTGSPEFGRFTESQGGIPSDTATLFANVIEQQYEAVVIPLIQEEFNKLVLSELVEAPQLPFRAGVGAAPSVDPSTTIPAQDVIQPVFRGGGVSFVARGGVSNTLTATAIRNLNKKVTPVLNRMIRSAAHIDGNRNYKKVYDERFVEIFGIDKPVVKEEE